MSKRPFVLFGLLAAVCLLVIPFFALGKEGDQDAALVKVEPQDQPSKELFADNCGACHTLAAAGTDGVVGPSLDEIITQGPAEAPRVLSAIDNGLGGRMPKGILLGEEAKQVAAFVAAYAGQIDKGPTVDIASAKKPDPAPCQTAAG